MRRACSDKDINAVDTGKSLQARSKVDRITDYRRIKSLMRLIGTNVSNQDIALVDAHAHTERHTALRFPLVIQLF